MTTGLFVHGGSNDQWTGLALSDLNMNGFSINNINTLALDQTDTTGCGASFHRNLAAADTDSPIVCIWDENAGDDQPALRVIQEGTGNGVFIDQNGDATALSIISAATTAASYGLLVETAAGARLAAFYDGSVNFYAHFCSPSCNPSFEFLRNYAAATTTGPVICMTQSNAGDDQDVLCIDQAGTGRGLTIDITAATGGVALDIDQDGDSYGIQVLSAATTNTQYGIRVVTGAGATVANFEYAGTEFARLGIHNAADGSNWFYRNLAAADTAGAVVFIEQDNVGDDQPALEIQQDGTGHGIDIDQNGDSLGVYIDTVATSAGSYGLKVSTGFGCNAAQFIESVDNYINIGSSKTSATGSSYFYRNLAAADTAGPVVFIKQDNAGDDQPALEIQQDGTGPSIEIINTQDLEVIDFDGCTDGGTTNTVIAESLKVQMPGGTTGYINFYTAPV